MDRSVMCLDGCGQPKLQLVKIGSHCPSKGGDEAFFSIPNDHMINESRDLVGEIPSP